MTYSPGEYLAAYRRLRLYFGDEFEKLSNTDATLVARDFLDAFNEERVVTIEYGRRIGKGNLQSYADAMQARAAKGW